MKNLKAKYARLKDLYENHISISDQYRRVIRGQNASIRKLNKKIQDLETQLKLQE